MTDGRTSRRLERVPAGATGQVYTISRMFGGTSTLSLLAGTDSNLSLSGTRILAAAAIGAGSSQTAVVFEEIAFEGVKYAVTVVGQAAAGSGTPIPTPTPTPAPTPTPTPANSLVAPVQDWRAVTTDVTDLSGTSDAAMQAQQASKATKTRGASFATGASASAGRTFKVAAHAQPLELYWWGLGQNGSSTVDVSTDAGATWTSTGFANQLIPGGTIADRTQCCRIPAGTAKWIRLTCSSSSSSYTVWPQLHEKPASGLSPVAIVWGNSIPHYHLAGDTSGSPATTPASAMNAIIAAAGGDPIIILASEPSAQIGGLQGHLTAVLNTWGSFASTAYLCGLIGGDATAMHPYAASQKASLDSAFDTFVGQVKAANLQVIIDELSFMFGASDETPLSTLADQSPGRGLYNVNVVWPKIQQHAPASYNSDLGVAQNGMYFWSIRRSADLTDGKHPTKNSFVDWQAYHANGWYKFWQTGTWGTHQVYQRINTAEASLLQADYDWLAPTLQLLPATAAKTAIVNRQATLLPLVLLKTANLAVVTYESTKTPGDKTTAQNAVTAAQNGGAPTSDVATAYGNTVNLSGTTNLTARINAVSSVTITKRAKVKFGKASTVATFNDYADYAAPTSLALLLTDGTTASGWTLTPTGQLSKSAANGPVAAGGIAPADFPASATGGYWSSNTNGIQTLTLTGFDPTKKYRFYWATGRSNSTDTSFTVTATGAGTAVVTGTKTANVANTLTIAGPDDGLKDIVPTSGGQIALASAHAGANASSVVVVGLIIEEYAA